MDAVTNNIKSDSDKHYFVNSFKWLFMYFFYLLWTLNNTCEEKWHWIPMTYCMQVVAVILIKMRGSRENFITQHFKVFHYVYNLSGNGSYHSTGSTPWREMPIKFCDLEFRILKQHLHVVCSRYQTTVQHTVQSLLLYKLSL